MSTSLCMGNYLLILDIIPSRYLNGFGITENNFYRVLAKSIFIPNLIVSSTSSHLFFVCGQ